MIKLAGEVSRLSKASKGSKTGLEDPQSDFVLMCNPFS